MQYVRPNVEVVKLRGSVAVLLGSPTDPTGETDPTDPFSAAPWRY